MRFTKSSMATTATTPSQAGAVGRRSRFGVHRLAGVASVVALAGTLTLAGVGSTPAGALTLQIFPTTTQVTASPNTFQDGQPAKITITATVRGFDLYLTPSGTVTFTIYGPQGNVYSGPIIAPLSHCLILVTFCTATAGGSASVLDIPAGVYTVVAAYSGDALAKKSAGSATYTVLAAPR